MGKARRQAYRQAALDNCELLLLFQDFVKMRQSLLDPENKATESESDNLVGNYFCVCFLLVISKLLEKTCSSIRAWSWQGFGE